MKNPELGYSDLTPEGREKIWQGIHHQVQLLITDSSSRLKQISKLDKNAPDFQDRVAAIVSEAQKELDAADFIIAKLEQVRNELAPFITQDRRNEGK